ncbi:PAS domain-containing protein, partial [Verrucomicrobiales bacterium]|nr:PAS domain-containing protein [Verrucomicrobiales bacterium]
MSRLDQRDNSETDFPWQRIPDALPMGLVVFNSQQDVIYVNSAHQNLLGVSVENFGGIEEWLENTCPNAEYAARVLNSWREHIWRKQLTRTFSLRSADQKLREIEFSAHLMDDGGLLLTQTDVTERRRNESQLKMGEKKFRAVFQNNPGGLLLVDRSGGILDANPVFEAFVGKSVNELRRMTLSDCLVPQDAL